MYGQMHMSTVGKFWRALVWLKCVFWGWNFVLMFWIYTCNHVRIGFSDAFFSILNGFGLLIDVAILNQQRKIDQEEKEDYILTCFFFYHPNAHESLIRGTTLQGLQIGEQWLRVVVVCNVCVSWAKRIANQFIIYCFRNVMFWLPVLYTTYQLTLLTPLNNLKT